MSNCGACKHWRSPGSDNGYSGSPQSLGLGECTKVRQLWDSTEWADESDDYKRVFVLPLQTKAFVQDGSDYHASLLTLPEFGCVQHEPKPEQTP